MTLNEKIRYVLNNPKELLIYLLRQTACLYPDRLYLKMFFPLKMGYKLNLKDPKTFSEKLQWLKLNNRRSEMVKMVDKVDAKEYVANIIGEKYIIPTLGIYNSVDEIDFNALPNQFVLKCTHDSGGVVICKDKSKLDIEAAKEKLRRGLKVNYYYRNREWPYKNVKPRIIVEKYLGDNLQDYRIYCFNGNPKLIYSYTNISKTDGSKPEPSYCDIMDTNWNQMPFRQNSPVRGCVSKPRYFSEMLQIAKKVSQGFPFLRVDFYECGDILVGELTFYPGSGMSQFRPIEWDYKLGSWLELSVD